MTMMTTMARGGLGAGGVKPVLGAGDGRVGMMERMRRKMGIKLKGEEGGAAVRLSCLSFPSLSLLPFPASLNSLKSLLTSLKPAVHWGFVTSHHQTRSGGDPTSARFAAHSSSSHPQLASSLSSTSSLSNPDAYGFIDEEEEEEEQQRRLDGGEMEEEEDELGEFVPGIYTALYPFEPELETEMRLEVGELVSVWERQCAGCLVHSRMRDLRKNAKRKDQVGSGRTLLRGSERPLWWFRQELDG